MWSVPVALGVGLGVALGVGEGLVVGEAEIVGDGSWAVTEASRSMLARITITHAVTNETMVRI